MAVEQIDPGTLEGDASGVGTFGRPRTSNRSARKLPPSATKSSLATAVGSTPIPLSIPLGVKPTKALIVVLALGRSGRQKTQVPPSPGLPQDPTDFGASPSREGLLRE